MAPFQGESVDARSSLLCALDAPSFNLVSRGSSLQQPLLLRRDSQPKGKHMFADIPLQEEEVCREIR